MDAYSTESYWVCSVLAAQYTLLHQNTQYVLSAILLSALLIRYCVRKATVAFLVSKIQVQRRKSMILCMVLLLKLWLWGSSLVPSHFSCTFDVYYYLLVVLLVTDSIFSTQKNILWMSCLKKQALYILFLSEMSQQTIFMILWVQSEQNSVPKKIIFKYLWVLLLLHINLFITDFLIWIIL